MNSIEEIFLIIVRASLFSGRRPDKYEMDEGQWDSLFSLARTHKLLGVVLDEVSCHPSNLSFRQRAKWTVVVAQAKKSFAHKREVLLHFRDLLAARDIPLMLLKGQGIAALYPKPELRVSSDIDIYTRGCFQQVNEMARNMGLVFEEDIDKHSAFIFEDVIIENHRKVNDGINAATKAVSDLLLARLDSFADTSPDLPGILLPDKDIYAFYVLMHTIYHYEWMAWDEENIVLGQIVDLALVFEHYGKIMDWGYFGRICNETRLKYPFSLFAMVIKKYLGISIAEDCYLAPCSDKSVDMVMNDVFSPGIHPLKAKNPVSKAVQAIRLRFNHFRKYRMIYREPFPVAFYRELQSISGHLGRFFRRHIGKNIRNCS